MYPHRYFGARYYGDRYFPQAGGLPDVLPPGVIYTGDATPGSWIPGQSDFANSGYLSRRKTWPRFPR